MRVLQQLNKLLIKYKSLGTSSKRAWDRLRWGTENLSEIREKLIAHTSSLTLFLATLGTGSLGRIEKKLDELIADVRAGRREQTVLTMADNDEGEADEQWKVWKRELVDDGFTKVEIEGHKHWIKARLLELIENGELQEQPIDEEVGPSTSKKQAAASNPVPEGVVIPLNHADVSRASTSGSPDKSRPDFQPSVEDVDEDEERTIDMSAIQPQTSQAVRSNRSSEKEADLNDEGDGWSYQFDSDDSDDTFLPTDSISNVGVNTTAVQPPASPTPIPIRNQPSPAIQENVTLGGATGRTIQDQSSRGTMQRPPQGRQAINVDAPRQATPRPAPASNKTPEQATVERLSTLDCDYDNDPEPRDVPQRGTRWPSPAKDFLSDDDLYQPPRGNLAPRYPERPIVHEDDRRDNTRNTNSFGAATSRGKPSPSGPQNEGPLDPKWYPYRLDTATQYMQSARKPNDPAAGTARSERIYHAAPRSRRDVPNDPRPANSSFEFNVHPLNKPNDGEVPPYGYPAGSQATPKLDPSNPENYYSPRYKNSEPYIYPGDRKGTSSPPPRTSHAPRRTEPEGRGRDSYQSSRNSGADFKSPKVESKKSSGPKEFTFSIPESSQGGFSFSNPESIFSEFLRGQSGVGGSDGFEDIFGSTLRGRDEKKGGKPRARSLSPTVIERPLPLTLEELFRGCHKRMKIKRKCFDEATGKRRTEDKILECPIKAGLKKGSKIKFKDVGDNQEIGGRQDLHFIIEEKPHPLFSREGDDLIQTLEIELLESLSGWKRIVTTIDGKQIAIEKGGPTQSGRSDSYPDLGMLLSKKPDTRGNFIVKYNIKYPMTITARAKWIIKNRLQQDGSQIDSIDF